MFSNVYNNRRVLITGHTGFKGSWLSVWLNQLGANICGISLLMTNTEYSHYDLLQKEYKFMDFDSNICDIRDYEKLYKIVQRFQPEIVFHLAAQPIVRYSYEEPLLTFQTNVLGTANLLEACRYVDSVRAIVVISSDKCYENKEQIWGYRETDSMGGYDPYSASKGCTELVVSSYRRSFFNNQSYQQTHHTLLASARAGNVIGGGDWGKDRLVPDIMRATAHHELVYLRNPLSTRPWQHVLEPLSGYLLLATRLYQGDVTYADAWNFGPSNQLTLSVEEATKKLAQYWNEIQYTSENNTQKTLHEAKLLYLDCTKANRLLSWSPILNFEETFLYTAQWYKSFYTKNIILTLQQLNQYITEAINQKIIWTE